MDWWRPDLFYPILGAVAAGGLIGFEREFRGRPAGFRTHILVSLAACLLMLAAVRQLSWAGLDAPPSILRIDPARMAHGVLTGVGFLCGGVIFRHGFSVHGLTTAASLWATSALGMLYGVGLYDLAVGGSLVTVTVLALLRRLESRLPRLTILDLAVTSRREDALTEKELRAALGEWGLTTVAVSQKLIDQGRLVQLSGTFRGVGLLSADAWSDRLLADPRVVGYEIIPRDD